MHIQKTKHSFFELLYFQRFSRKCQAFLGKSNPFWLCVELKWPQEGQGLARIFRAICRSLHVSFVPFPVTQSRLRDEAKWVIHQRQRSTFMACLLVRENMPHAIAVMSLEGVRLLDGNDSKWHKSCTGDVLEMGEAAPPRRGWIY